MATQNLGRVGLVLKGEWDSTTAYTALDVVSHDGNAWAAKQNSTNVEPTTSNSDFWQLFSNNADLVVTVQGLKEDAAGSAAAAAKSASDAEESAHYGEEAVASIAPTFSTSENYAAGEYVWYHGVPYRFTADHAAGVWTGTDAEEVKIGAEVADLKSAIKNSKVLSGILWERGAFTTSGGEQTSTTRIRSQFVDVRPGDHYDVSGNPDCLSVYQYDSTYTFISYSTWSSAYTIPTGVTYIRLLIRKSSDNPTINTSDIAEQAARATVYRILPPEVCDTDTFDKETNAFFNNSESLSGYTWALGALDGSGVQTSSTNRIRSNYIPVSPGDIVDATGEICCLATHYYTSAKAHIGNTVFKAGNKYVVPTGVAFVRLVMRKSVADETITTDDIATVASRAFVRRVIPGNIYSGLVDQSEIDEINDRIDAIVSDTDMFSDFGATPVINANYYGGYMHDWGNSPTRLLNKSTISYPIDVVYRASPGYTIGIFEFAQPHTFTGNGAYASVRDSGGYVEQYIAKAGANVIIVVNHNNQNIAESEWATAVSVGVYPMNLVEMAALVESVVAKPEYFYTGEKVNVSCNGYNVSGLMYTNVVTESGGKTGQGFAVYGDILFQFFADDLCRIFDMKNNTIIGDVTGTFGHANGVCFSNEFYDEDDEFPLAYVAADDGSIYVNRITRSGATLIKTLVFDGETFGYHAEAAYDADSGEFYVVASLNNASAQTGYYSTGYRVSKCDLSDLTDNGDDTYTPAVISTFDVPISTTDTVLQGLKCLHGCLFLASGWHDTTKFSKINVLDIAKQRIVSTFTDFPSTLKIHELEDLAFIKNDLKTNYRIICMVRGYGYYIIDI